MKKTSAALLIIALLTLLLPCYANDTEAELTQPSSWAVKGIAKAIEAGYIPQELQKDYQSSISRIDFARVAVNFAATCFGYKPGNDDLPEHTILRFFQDYCSCRSDPSGEAYNIADYFPDVSQDALPESWGAFFNGHEIYSPFTDLPTEQDDVEYTAEERRKIGSDMIYAGVAHIIGIVNGRSDDIFDPFGSISRQEAAAMLVRTYRLCGGTLKSYGSGPVFADNGSISSWARESVQTVSLLGVMNGVGGGKFDPGRPYTVEQCITTFQRLAEVMNTDIIPLRSYEQTWEAICADTLPVELKEPYEISGERHRGMVIISAEVGGVAGLTDTHYLYVLSSAGGWYRVKELPEMDIVLLMSLSEDESLLNIMGIKDRRVLYFDVDLESGRLLENSITFDN